MGYVGQYQPTDNYTWGAFQPQTREQQGGPQSPWGGQNLLFPQQGTRQGPGGEHPLFGRQRGESQGGDVTLSIHGPGGANPDAKGYSDDLKAHAQKYADKDGNLSAEGLGQALGGVKLDDKSMKYFDLDGDGKVNVKEAAVAERHADGCNTKREDGSGAEALDGKISTEERDNLQKQIDISSSAQNQEDQIKVWHGSTMLGAGVGY